ncbi:hypothetical protein I4U23_001255 [Adineta vaga]|nr:hypothetical protein I4U23_001255 [Adineta vaga]
MSLTLLLICRRSIGLTSFSQIRSSLLRPVHCSSNILIAKSSTLKSKYGSLNPSPQNPFREPTDEKSRRLQLQAHIRFRERYQLDNDYELIFALPRQRLYSLLHLLCTCATVSMIVFVVMHLHRDLLDMESFEDEIHRNVPPWILYAVATVIGSAFASILILITRIPIRLYYSSVRQSYALFYHPLIGVFRQKKILFADHQYKIVSQKLDSINGPERTTKIRIQLGTGLFSTKYNFYLIENYFRSKRDINRLKNKNIEQDTKTNENEKYQSEEESNIWQTVVEKKDQPQRSRTFFK